MTHFELDDAQKLIDWLMERGLGLGESARVIADMECGDSLSLAIRKVFKQRELMFEELKHTKLPDWGNPLTP